MRQDAIGCCPKLFRYTRGIYTLIGQGQSAGHLSSMMAENRAPVIHAMSVYFLLFLVNSKHLQTATTQSEAGGRSPTHRTNHKLA